MEEEDRFLEGFRTGDDASYYLPFVFSGVTAALAFFFMVPSQIFSVIAFWGIVLMVLSVLVFIGFSLYKRIYNHVLLRGFNKSLWHSETISFVTDHQGRLVFLNKRAMDRLGGDTNTLLTVMQSYYVNPAAVLHRLYIHAVKYGKAVENMHNRNSHSQLSVRKITSCRFLWHVEEDVNNSVVSEGFQSKDDVLIITVGEDNHVVCVNHTARELFGKIPRRLEDIFQSADLKNGDIVEISSVKDESDKEYLSKVAFITSQEKGLRNIYLFSVDVLSHKAQPMDDFENLPVALIRFSSKGVMLDANRVACDILNISRDGNYTFHSLYEGLGRSVQDWLLDVANDRVKGGAEFLNPRLAGYETFHQVTLRRTLDSGQPCVIAVLQDATAIKLMEAQFVQSQKMQAIGQLAGGIAHDFNNLLTAISGHCDLLFLRHSHEDGDYADLIQIQQNTNRAAALVSQLLAFSRKQTLKPEYLDPQEVLADLMHLLNRLVGERVQLHFQQGNSIGKIRVDKRQFEQVLMNLVVNARDAMAQGGVVVVETKEKRLTQELLRDRAIVPTGNYALIKVSDMGHGIAPDKINKIFEPFFTTKEVGEGTGLGLSTVYGIVKQSGGFVFVDSVVGKGTTFHLYFPIDSSESYNPKEILQPERPAQVLHQGDGIVLLAEDEVPVRAFACRALRMRGYTVLEAENGEKALEILEDQSLHVDLFITDVVMPGLDGPSWVKKALENRPNTKSIFMSGYAKESVSEEQIQIPNSSFISKPFSLSELTAMVQESLEGELVH